MGMALALPAVYARSSGPCLSIRYNRVYSRSPTNMNTTPTKTHSEDRAVVLLTITSMIGYLRLAQGSSGYGKKWEKGYQCCTHSRSLVPDSPGHRSFITSISLPRTSLPDLFLKKHHGICKLWDDRRACVGRSRYRHSWFFGTCLTAWTHNPGAPPRNSKPPVSGRHKSKTAPQHRPQWREHQFMATMDDDTGGLLVGGNSGANG